MVSRDRLSIEERSALMAKIRSKDTKPERRVRKIAHAMGYRFRLSRRDLPGTPDIVFPRYKLAVFVHGCFWHRHPGCPRASVPATRAKFWKTKFAANVTRDAAALEALKDLGWRTLVIWECETKNSDYVRALLRRALSSGSGSCQRRLGSPQSTMLAK